MNGVFVAEREADLLFSAKRPANELVMYVPLS
jgi:hypothetical protein